MGLIYYTATIDLDLLDEDLYEATGNKTVYVYKIENNKPVLLHTLHLKLSDITIEHLKELFENNNFIEL